MRLQKRCCNSNSAQYEKNRRFRQLAYALGWLANGAKLPCVGLRLNAAKPESRKDPAPEGSRKPEGSRRILKDAEVSRKPEEAWVCSVWKTIVALVILLSTRGTAISETKRSIDHRYKVSCSSRHTDTVKFWNFLRSTKQLYGRDWSQSSTL